MLSTENISVLHHLTPPSSQKLQLPGAVLLISKMYVGSLEHLVSLKLMSNSLSPFLSTHEVWGQRKSSSLWNCRGHHDPHETPNRNKTFPRENYKSQKVLQSLRTRESHCHWSAEKGATVQSSARTIENSEPSPCLKTRPMCDWKRLTHILKSS